jgi:hypothetical protein
MNMIFRVSQKCFKLWSVGQLQNFLCSSYPTEVGWTEHREWRLHITTAVCMSHRGQSRRRMGGTVFFCDEFIFAQSYESKPQTLRTLPQPAFHRKWLHVLGFYVLCRCFCTFAAMWNKWQAYYHIITIIGICEASLLRIILPSRLWGFIASKLASLPRMCYSSYWPLWEPDFDLLNSSSIL